MEDKFVSQEKGYGSITTTDKARDTTKTYCRDDLFRTIKWRFKVADERGNRLLKELCLGNLGYSEKMMSSKLARETWDFIKKAANDAIQVRRNTTAKSIKEKFVDGEC